jgi:hypothetical protein
MAYGQNQDNRASSDTPGKNSTSPLADELRSKQRGRDAVIANGAKHRDDPAAAFHNRGNVKQAPAATVGCKPSTPADTPRVPGGNGRQPTTR